MYLGESTCSDSDLSAASCATCDHLRGSCPLGGPIADRSADPSPEHSDLSPRATCKDHCTCGEGCPERGLFYVTARHNGLSTFLLGPYMTHAEARGRVVHAERLANYVDPRAHFYAYGTARWRGNALDAPLGKLRDFIHAEEEEKRLRDDALLALDGEPPKAKPRTRGSRRSA